jgi:hypothetical protein
VDAILLIIVKMDEGLKPFFPIGTILVGEYSVGYWTRWAYFRVVSHTQSGAPRVCRLREQIVSSSSSSVESRQTHELDLTRIVEYGAVLVSRWSQQRGNCWCVVLKDNNNCIRARLSPYVPGTQYTEVTYY